MAFLQEGEKIILEEKAKSDFFGKGTLYLTNTRVVLEVMTGGFFSRTTEVKIDQPIRTMRMVATPGRKTLQIHFEGNMEPTTLYVENPAKWEAAIKTLLMVGGST
jgi:hypothetical protein